MNFGYAWNSVTFGEARLASFHVSSMYVKLNQSFPSCSIIFNRQMFKHLNIYAIWPKEVVVLGELGIKHWRSEEGVEKQGASIWTLTIKHILFFSVNSSQLLKCRKRRKKNKKRRSKLDRFSSAVLEWFSKAMKEQFFSFHGWRCHIIHLHNKQSISKPETKTSRLPTANKPLRCKIKKVTKMVHRLLCVMLKSNLLKLAC